jgi:competence protein ComEA
MDDFIEKYKFHIGIILSLAIIFGGILLLWQKDILKNISQKTKLSNEVELENYKKENEDLKKQLAELEQKIQDEKSKPEVKSEEVSVSDKININSAQQSELEKLPGVGPARAQAIIDYRLQNGGFKTIDEIQNIKGIGPATFAKMANMICVD